MPRVQHGRARLLLVALGVAGACAESSDACEGATCSVGDAASLVQRPRHRSAPAAEIMQTEPLPPIDFNCALDVRVYPTAYFKDGKMIPAGSDMNLDFCAANSCCNLYPDISYPCPSPVPGNHNCTLDGTPSAIAMELVMELGYMPKPKHPNFAMCDCLAYDNVTLKDGKCLAQFLEEQPGIEKAVVLQSHQTGYEEGLPSSTSNRSLSYAMAMASVWGDLGPEVNPGFGGLQTYNVVNLTASKTEPLQLFRLGNDPTYICSGAIWWGLKSSFSHSLEDVSVKLQTCGDYSHLLRCSFTGEAPITALVGQGWNRTEDGFKSSKCGDNWVANKLRNRSYPSADQNDLQIVLPACDLAFEKNMKCDLCTLPKDPNQTMAIQDLASQFEKQDNNVTCAPWTPPSPAQQAMHESMPGFSVSHIDWHR